jgi:hypothetical protein
MKKLPVKSRRRAPRKAATTEVIPAPSRAVASPWMAMSFLSFQMHAMEVTRGEGGTRVKAKQARFEDGKLTTEAFDGMLPVQAYGEMVQQMQDYFAAQAEMFMKPYAMFLEDGEKKR